MTRRKWTLLACAMAMTSLGISCRSAIVRPDPFPSPSDQGGYSLHLRACGQEGESIGCSLGASESFESKPIEILAPLPGTLDIIGCNTTQNLVVESPGSFRFYLPDFEENQCIYDLAFNWRLPKGFDSELPVRALRGKLFVVRQSKDALPALILSQGGKLIQTGVGTIQADQDLNGSDLYFSVQFSKPSKSGIFQLTGCGMGVKALAFSGSSVTLSLRDVIGMTAPPKECLLFGWAVDHDGLNDEFALGLTLHAAIEPLAASVVMKDKRVCYAADPHATIVTYGHHFKNSLRGCFDRSDSDLVGFFSVKGRGAYRSLSP